MRHLLDAVRSMGDAIRSLASATYLCSQALCAGLFQKVVSSYISFFSAPLCCSARRFRYLRKTIGVLQFQNGSSRHAGFPERTKTSANSITPVCAAAALSRVFTRLIWTAASVAGANHVQCVPKSTVPLNLFVPTSHEDKRALNVQKL